MQLLHKEVRDKLKAGVDKVADIVKITMGSKGSLVMIENPAFDDVPYLTKDGARVARSVSSSCPYEQMAIKMVNDATRKVANEVGDGTTTTTVLIQALLDAALKSKENDKTLSYKFRRAADFATNLLISEYSKDFSHASLRQVANLSLNGDWGHATLIAECFEQVGRYGVIKVVEEINGKSRNEFEEGFRVDGGYITEKFMGGAKSLSYESPYVIVCRDELKDANLIKKHMEYIAESNSPVIILAPSFSDDIMGLLLYSHLNQGITINLVRLPEHGDKQELIIQDIATYINAEFDSVSKVIVGSVEEAIVTGEKLTLINSESTTFQYYCEEALKEMKAEEDEYYKEFLKQRYGNMTSKVATLYIGARDEVNMQELRDRIDDALGSARSCFWGILPGGGNALASIVTQTSEICPEFAKCLLAPRNQIMSNAGIELDWDEPSEFNKGYSLHEFDEKDSFKIEKDLRKKGVVDSTKVVTDSLLAATNVVTLLLRTKGIILTKT